MYDGVQGDRYKVSHWVTRRPAAPGLLLSPLSPLKLAKKLAGKWDFTQTIISGGNGVTWLKVERCRRHFPAVRGCLSTVGGRFERHHSSHTTLTQNIKVEVEQPTWLIKNMHKNTRHCGSPIETRPRNKAIPKFLQPVTNTPTWGRKLAVEFLLQSTRRIQRTIQKLDRVRKNPRTRYTYRKVRTEAATVSV